MKMKLFVRGLTMVACVLAIACVEGQTGSEGFDGAELATLEQGLTDRDVTCTSTDPNLPWRSVNTFCYTQDGLAGYEVKTYKKDFGGSFSVLDQDSTLIFESIAYGKGKNRSQGKSDYDLKLDSAGSTTGVVTLYNMTWLPLRFSCNRSFHTVPDPKVSVSGVPSYFDQYNRCRS